MVYETRLRSVVKTLIWYTLGLGIIFCISFALTQNAWISLMTGLTYIPIRMIIYYIYERIWTHIKWGRNVHNL